MACDPNTLSRESGCFFCLPAGYYYPIKLAILARWLRTLDPAADTTVQGLMSSTVAKCFACPPGAQLGPLKLALICDATSGSAPPVPPPAPSNLDIDTAVSGDGDISLTWTNNGGATSIEVFKSVNGGAYGLFTTLAGAATGFHDMTGMNPLDYWEWKVRAVSAGGNSAFTTPAGAAFGITDHASANISFPNLIQSFDLVNLINNVALITMSFPRLRQIDGDFIFFNCPNLTTITVSALIRVLGGITFSGCTSLASAGWASLASVGNDMQGQNNFALAAMDVSALNAVGGNLNFDQCILLPSLGLNALTSLGGNMSFPNCSVLTSVNVPVWAVNDGTLIDFTSTLLDQASVDLILHRGILATPSACDFELGGVGPSAPSGAGNADAVALGLLGNTVVHN